MRTDLSPSIPVRDELTNEYLCANRVLPLSLDGGCLRLAAVGEPATHVIEDMVRLYRVPVEIVAADEGELIEAIRRARAATESVVELVRDMDGLSSADFGSEGSTTDLRDLANQPPVIRFVNLLIREAFDARASDVHLDATRDGLAVRFRVDGMLTPMPAPPRTLQDAVLSRLKLLAQLDISERRLPQDGRFRVRLESRELDLRLATMPAHFGESATLRLLDRGGRPVTLDELGMSPEVLSTFRAIVSRPHGIILATGPTGSGKTTTLYSALALRDASVEKIITVEDPVEYELAGVTQVAVSEKTGLTFARALRGLVRHDPDVMMIGEMRDEETADIAVRAAMTGHLVFSTLHTNEACAAIPRLLDLKVPAYLAAATIDAIVAQRLVRRICAECQERYRPDPAVVALLAGRPVGRIQLVRGAGCARCRGTGYSGRLGLFELVTATDGIRDAIGQGADAARLRDIARESGFLSLKQDGWIKVEAGLTTIEEVMRVVQ